MAKKLNTISVNMRFNTDTKQAKKQVEDLQNSLNKLISSTAQIHVDSSDIRTAINATAELQSHLKNAINVDTGNLDFGKLSQSLKKSGKSLQEYGNILRNLGPQGQQAFMQLAQAVASAEVPIKRTNALLKEFANTLANTARWQISSSIIHGFTGALQSAYGYAQDLNESLNNIRIVTGRNVEDMADFAKEANKAAKALSTTTTKYTDASLIYYQQGLDDKEVKERADVTIKLANVSRQSAQEVSEQMTAIWNNFDDGSKSLEHYANVLSALGAATASSTEEIAGGLEKFAAVADTIGLSYEYAAAALATITSNTRQSEEVVGTALKTIFARIQGLNLGETLEDGTTLNKYSEALNKVGINIYDINGQLKDMDTILNNLGSKWNQLGKDQQVALAQTVAGVRQYNQLIALMDNWNKGDNDSFMANLTTANTSAGALNKQADIYAEGWEAAAERVTAAAQAIYDSLIDDEFFIDLLNNIEKLLGFVNNLIEGLGGLKGVLFSLGAIVTKVFSQQMSQGLTNLAYNVQMMTKTGRQKIQDKKSDFIKDAADKLAKSANTGEAGYDQKKAAELYEQQLYRQQELIDNADKMSEIEKSTVQTLMDQLKLRGELAMQEAQSYEQSKQHLSDQADLLYQRAAGKGSDALNNAAASMQNVKDIISQQRELEAFAPEERTSMSVRKFTAGIDIISPEDQEQINQLADALDNPKAKSQELNEIWMKIKATIANITDNEIAKTADALGATKEEVEEYASAYEDNLIAQEKNNKATKEFKDTSDSIKKTIKEAKGEQQTWSDTLVASANAAMSFASALSMVGGMWDTLRNPDLSGWQKFTTVLTTLGMLIPTLITAWNSFQTLLKSETVAKLKNVAATIAQTIAEKKLNDEKGTSSSRTKKSIKETITDTKEKLKKTGTKIKDKVSGGWGKIKDGWNQRALENSKDFKQINGGGYQAQGKMAQKHGTKLMSKANAGKLAGKQALVNAGGAAVAAALVVAAVVAYKQLDKVLNKNELAAQKAEKAAQNLATAYANASQKYNDLLNTMSNYDNAKKSLEGLTKGTVDFSKAVQDANAEATKLIENYGDIIGNEGYTVDSNGVIQITDDALEKIKKQEYAKLQQAQMASSVANRKARETRIAADMTKLNREKIKSKEGFLTAEDGLETGQWAAGGMGAGAAIGAVAGSILPGVGTLIGGLVGAGIGAAAGAVTGVVKNVIDKNSETDKEKEAFEKLEAAYREKGEMVFEDSEIQKLFPTDTFGNLADELIKNKDAVKELVKEMAANTAATRAENLAMTNQILSNNTKVQESEHADYIDSFVADAYGKKSEEIYQQIMDQKSTNFFGVGTDEWKSTWEEYAAETDLDDLNGYKVKNYKKDGSVVYEYIDEEGKKQKATVTKEQIAAEIAAKKAREETENLGEQAVDILKDVDKDTVKLLAGAKDNNMSESTIGTLKNKDAEQYTNLTEEELHALGFTGTKTDIITSIQNQQDAQLADIKNLANDYGSKVGEAMGSILGENSSKIANVTQGTLKQYASTMDQIVSVGGNAMLGQFNTFITGLTESNANQADAIMATANSIDWTQGEVAIQDFNYQLLKMGINIDENSDEWKTLAKSLQEANVSVLKNDLESVRKKLTEIQALTKDIEIGSVISDEDYDNLIKYNAALADQFVMTADGYMYAGKKGEDGKRVNDIKSVADDIAMSQLEGLRDVNARAKAASSAMTSSGYNFKSLANGIASADDQTKAAAFLAGDDENAQAMRAALGISKDEFADLQTALGGTDPEAKQKAQDKLKQVYTDLLTIQGNDAAGQYSSTRADEVWASTQGYETLKTAKENNTIDATVADTYMQILKQKESEVELEEAERYAAVNHELETMEQHLSTINKLKDRASNSERIALIAKEADALKKQADAQADYLKEVKTNLATDKTALSAYGFTDDMFNTDGSIKKDKYNTVYTEQLKAYQQAQKDLALKNIDEAEFAEKEKAWQDFNEATDKYKGTLSDYANAQDTLIDSNNQFYTSMVTAYTETLSNAGEELSKYTARMEHHNSVLDHYKNLSSLIGKETDYAVMNEYLEGQAHLAENTLKISKASYAMYKNEADALKAKMDAAVAGSDNFKTYKEQWEAAEEKAREAENQMLSDLQAWAESEKAILENTLADLGKTLEESLTGGLSFDKLNTQMERAASLQEDYLTTTNKIYETTKMMRAAQQAIDTSTNAVAKEKLKGFINETKSMQEQGKLSQYELDMQQAKYDLLVAEIALEEAQNAKSTVRLQRDSEGNFGYVYTADASAVGEAQQKFDDAQNALYNKGLEGANNYTQKYQETMSQMTDTLSQIQSDYLAGSYESEEAYQNAMAEAKSYYFEKLQSYSELYGVALAADSKIAGEAWSTEFEIMTKSTTEWGVEVDKYITGVTNAFNEWEKVASTVEEVTGKDLSSVTAHVNDITTASDTLAKALLGENGEGGLIAELKQGFKDVADTISSALASWTGITITTGEDGTITVTPNPAPAATGGLTSAWGPEGKMLMVHENELILNSDQTNKFFDNLAIMESILSAIDSYAIGQQLGGMLASPGYGGNTMGALEQNVKIEASFPGVTDRNEIEEAFNNLVNKASQYANRK